MNVYICHTLYHLYLSLMRAAIDHQYYEKKSIIILADSIENAEGYMETLKSKKFIENALFVNDKHITNRIRNNYLKILFYRKYILNEYQLYLTKIDFKDSYTQYKINLFIDTSDLSKYFMMKYKSVTLLEDGIGIYRTYRKNYKYFLKIFLGLPKEWGRSKYIKKIEVARPEKLSDDLKHKASKANIESMVSLINNDTLSEINDIFLKNVLMSTEKINNEKKIIILTQPFSEDHIITEDEKVKLYESIIKKFSIGEEYILIIKPHPREKTDYSKIFDNVIILEKNFPVELMNNVLTFSEDDLCITINSSALNNLNCKHKKMLGLDFDTNLHMKYCKLFNLEEGVRF